MKYYTISITDLAEQDLENAGDYIAHQLLNPSAAANIVNEIRNQINELQRFPERNHLEDSREKLYQTYKI